MKVVSPVPMAKNAKVDEAYALYTQGQKLVDIAKQLDLPEGTVRRWKCTYGWSGERSQKKKANVRKKRGAPYGNHNGHGSGPGNKNAEKHGLLARYLPEETRELLGITENSTPLELLWSQIQIAYAAIIRAQKIAYVKDQDDHTTETVMEGCSDTGSTAAYEIQHSWDKQEAFLKAQARAQSELRSMIKQYDEMLHKDWTVATDLQKARLDLIQSQVGAGADQVDKVVIINDTDTDQ
jgi:uncharacterized protein YjcR